MESLIDFGPEASRWLQENYPQLETFFATISAFGRFNFYLVLIPLIYWCFNKRTGIAVALLMLLADTTTAMTKHGLRDPRPYWIDPEVAADTSDNLYGFPSGHTGGATVFYLFLASQLRRRRLWLLAIILVLLMAFSRLYLGAHDIPDIIGGFLVGFTILALYLLWQRYLSRWLSWRKRILGQKLLVAVSVPFFLIAVYIGIRLLIGEVDMSVPYAAILEEAERDSQSLVITDFSLLLGLAVGFLFEASRVRFLVDGPAWKRGLRFLLGIAGIMAIVFGLDQIFPEDPLWLAIPFRIIRYGLGGLWVAYYAPLLFIHLHLADANPEPEIGVRI